MLSPKVRLVVSAILFFGWLGFLFWLVVNSNAIVLSRPQFLVAQVYLVAEVRDKNGQPDVIVHVTEVPWSADPKDAALANSDIPIIGLDTDRLGGYRGPGVYLMPLQKTMARGYRLAPLPSVGGAGGELRIYPWTTGTERQLREIIAQK